MPGQLSTVRCRLVRRRSSDGEVSAASADVDAVLVALPEQAPEVRPPAALLRRQVLEAGLAQVEAEEVLRQQGRRSSPYWPIAVSRRHAQRPGQQNSTAPRWWI